MVLDPFALFYYMFVTFSWAPFLVRKKYYRLLNINRLVLTIKNFALNLAYD